MIRVKYWLWLTMVFGVGNNRLWDIMRYFDDPISAYEELCTGEFDSVLKEKEIENIHTTSLEKCTAIIDICTSKGYGITGYSSREYPQYLRHIYNPPAVLFYQGDIDILNRKPSVTMVGTRKASPQSIATAERLSAELAKRGFIIASGFAVGIDIASHLATANQGLPTVCVLGCGLDINYPKDNFIHRDTILKNNGVFITEYFPGTSPLPQNFPKRNRILSGISRAVIVIEAGEQSGALITAELALEQGREVFCLPPANIYDERYFGNIKFLREGAYSVYGAEDIICYFNIFNEQISLAETEICEEISQNDETNEESEIIEESCDEDSIDIQENENRINDIEDTDVSGFSEQQKAIIRLLMGGKLHSDIIADKIGIDISELMMELTDLELDGVILSFPGKIYGLK